MSAVLVQPDIQAGGGAVDLNTRSLKNVTGLLSGETDWSAPVSLTGLSDAAAYSLTVQNQGAGGKHINVPGILVVDATGVAVGTLTATNITVTGTATLNIVNASGLVTLSRAGTALSVTNDATIGGTSTLAVVNASGLVTLSKAGLALSVTNNVTIGGTLGVTGLSTLGALTATGNVALGDANADTITVIGVSTFRNAANSATQAVFDPGNNRVILLSSTALGSDTTPAVHVVGRLYVAPESANDHAIQIRRSSAATNGWWIGMTTDPNGDLIFKDDGDTERFRVGDASSSDQAVVTGRMTVSNGLVISASGANITGGITLATGNLVVSTGNVTVTAGGLTVTAGSIQATAGGISAGASSSFTGGVTIVNTGLTILAGGANITGTLVVSSTATINGELSAKAPVVGAASGNLTLTSSYQDISGCSVSLTPGNWLVTGFFFMAESGAGDLNQDLTGKLVTTGGTATISNSTSVAVFTPQTANETATVGQAWAVNVTATTTAKLQAKKLAGTGASVAAATQTTITAVFVGKP